MLKTIPVTRAPVAASYAAVRAMTACGHHPVKIRNVVRFCQSGNLPQPVGGGLMQSADGLNPQTAILPA